MNVKVKREISMFRIKSKHGSKAVVYIPLEIIRNMKRKPPIKGKATLFEDKLEMLFEW